MKKTTQKQEPAGEPTVVASFCGTDLAPLQMTRSLMETMGRFHSTLVPLSTAYVDKENSELVLTDHEVGQPGWILETRIPCRVQSQRTWSTSAIPLFREMLRNPPPARASEVLLTLVDGKPAMEVPGEPDARKSWRVQGTLEQPPSKKAKGQAPEVAVPSALLLRLIESVAPSVCADTTRQHLAQILIEVEPDQVASVSTDGHRLTRTEIRTALPSEIRGEVFVPLSAIKPLVQLLRSSPEVRVSRYPGGDWSVRVGVHRFMIQPASAPFPPYRQVIPPADRFGPRMLLETKPLLGALRHFELAHKAMRDSKVVGVALEVTPDRLRIWSDTLSDQDKVLTPSEVLWDAESGGKKKAADSSSLSIGIGLRYLLSAVRQIGEDQVWLDMSGELDPLVLRPASCVTGGLMSGTNTFVVVMPMRL